MESCILIFQPLRFHKRMATIFLVAAVLMEVDCLLKLQPIAMPIAEKDANATFAVVKVALDS